MKTKKLFAAFLIGILITTYAPVYGDPLSDQLKNQQQELQQNKNTYNGIGREITQAESNIEKLDEQINDMLDQINVVNSKIDQTKLEISNTEKDIVKSQDDLKSEEDLFGKRVNAMYKSGMTGYLDILLQSQSFDDFLSRIDMISRIIAYDKGVMNDLKIKNDEINKKKQELAQENAGLLSLQQQNQSKLAEMSSAKSSQNSLIADLRNKQKLYASRMSEYQSQIDETMKQIQAMKQQQKSITPLLASRGISLNASGSAIVSYAADFLGTPYVWGGNTPAGFDCSGFTKYVFAHFGINLYRRASEQALQGIPVSRNNLQPGDLVFFGNPVYHVGIYVGNGCFIHAPETGEAVKITPLEWMDFTGARRVR